MSSVAGCQRICRSTRVRRCGVFATLIVIGCLFSASSADASEASSEPTAAQAKGKASAVDPVKDAVLKAANDPGKEFRVVSVHPGEGEICIVCGDPIAGDQTCVLLQFRGRMVTVNKVLLEDLRADPEKYFRKLQSRGALFDESAVMPDQMNKAAGWWWFAIGVYILAGLMMGGACSYVAVTRGHPPMPWFLLGLFLNGIAMLMLLSKGQGDVPAIAGMPGGLSKVPDTHTPTACEKCGATNHPSAKACSGCGAAMTSAFESEASKFQT